MPVSDRHHYNFQKQGLTGTNLVQAYFYSEFPPTDNNPIHLFHLLEFEALAMIVLHYDLFQRLHEQVQN